MVQWANTFFIGYLNVRAASSRRKQVKCLGQAMEVWEAHDTIGVKRLTTRADKLADLLGAAISQSSKSDWKSSTHPIRPGPPSVAILPDDGAICKTTR
jgi:hypothetical protein